MLTHITLGTNDLERARVFYDKVLEPLALKRLFSVEQASGWGRRRRSSSFCVRATVRLLLQVTVSR
jgi:catechol 2,3-dioxygenase-like lactoylglutathione lyase family enzyme